MPNVAAHPFLFFLVGTLAAVETGLTAYQVWVGEDRGWPSDEFRNRMGFLLFTAAWTLLFALLHCMCWLGIGWFWAILTFVFWTVATALFRKVQPYDAGDCSGSDINSACRRLVAIEAIGWTEVALTALLVLALTFFWHGSRSTHGGYYRSHSRRLY